MLAEPESIDHGSLENYTYSKTSTFEDGEYSDGSRSSYSSDGRGSYEGEDNDDDFSQYSDDNRQDGVSTDRDVSESIDDINTTRDSIDTGYASTKESATPATPGTPSNPPTPQTDGYGFWSPLNYVKNAFDTYLSPQSDITTDVKAEPEMISPPTNASSTVNDRSMSVDSHRGMTESQEGLTDIQLSESSSFDENDTQFSVDETTVETSKGSPQKQETHPENREESVESEVTPERLEDRFERENHNDATVDSTPNTLNSVVEEDSHEADTATRSTVDLADSDNFQSVTQTWSGTNSEDSSPSLNSKSGDSESSDGVEIQLEEFEENSRKSGSSDSEKSAETELAKHLPTAQDSSVPDSNIPDSTAPDSAMPDSTTPDSAMPDSTTLDSAMPDSAIQESSEKNVENDQQVSSSSDPKVSEEFYSNVSTDSGLVFSVSTDDTTTMYRSLSPVIPISRDENLSAEGSDSLKSPGESVEEAQEKKMETQVHEVPIDDDHEAKVAAIMSENIAEVFRFVNENNPNKNATKANKSFSPNEKKTNENTSGHGDQLAKDEEEDVAIPSGETQVEAHSPIEVQEQKVERDENHCKVEEELAETLKTDQEKFPAPNENVEKESSNSRDEELHEPSYKKDPVILKIQHVEEANSTIDEDDLSFAQDENVPAEEEPEQEKEVTPRDEEECANAGSIDDLSFSQGGSYDSIQMSSLEEEDTLYDEEEEITAPEQEGGEESQSQLEEGGENLVKKAEELAEAKAKSELSELNSRLEAEKRERSKAVEEARRLAEEKAAALKREVEAQIQADQYAADLRAEEEAMRLKAEQEVFRLKTVEQARLAAERDAARLKAEEDERLETLQAEEEALAAKREAEEEAQQEELMAEEIAEAAKLKAEEQVRARIEHLSNLKTQEEMRLQIEKDAAIAKAEQEATQQLLREEEESRLKMRDTNRKLDAKKKVESVFDNLPAYLESEMHSIKGRVVVNDEQKRHVNRILSPDSPWWTRLESISNKLQHQQSTEEIASVRKAQWLLKQMQESETSQKNSSSNQSVEKKDEESENIYQRENRIWWRVTPRSQDALQQPSHDRHWYHFANDQEGQLNIFAPEVGYKATLPPGRKRKMTSIATKTWLTLSEKEKALQIFEKVDASGVPEKNENVVDQSEEVKESDDMAIEEEKADDLPQTVESVVDYLMKNVASSLVESGNSGSFSHHRVSFKNPVPNIPLIAPPNNDEILMKNTIRHKPVDTALSTPSPQIKELISGAYSDSITRRSNACGTLKLMSSQKKSVVTLGNTKGIIDALLFVARQSAEGEDARAILTCRHRALTTIALLCQPKENRRHICEHRELVPYLINVINNHKGETRLHACSAIAALAKTEENRDILMKANGLVAKLSSLLVTLKNEAEMEAPEDETPEDTKRRLTQQKVTISTRLNVCATLLHLSKQCSVSAAICADEQMIKDIATLSADLTDQVHSRCLETLCHLTRLPSNTDALAVSPETALALHKCAASENSVDRVWALRALQNITAHASEKSSFVTKEMLEVLCVSAEKLSAPVEHEAAIAVIGNLCTDLASTMLIVNTHKVVNILVNVANNIDYSPEIQFVACDALATIAMWIQRVAQAGSVPQGCAFEPLPTFKSAGYMRYHKNEF